MKVLIVRPFPERLNINAYNVQEIGLARALRKKGVDCDIVFFNGKDGDRTEAIEDGITIYWLGGINIFKNGLFFRLKQLTENYDVIQVHEYDQIQSWLIYTFGRKPVVIYHGPYYDSFNRGYNLKCRVFDALFLPFSKGGKNRAVCATKSLFAADFLRSKGFKHVKAVGVGLNVASFDDDATEISEKWSLSPECFNAVYVGKLEERRNISFLMDLAQRAAESYKDFKLTVVGKFDDLQYKEKVGKKFYELVDKGVINYAERASQKELASLYSMADVFLFTTNYDIFGMVLLEAMYYGVVPLSSLNGGSVTLIENGCDGFVFKEYDTEKWMGIIKALHDDPELLGSLKRNAHRKIQEHFTWDALSQQFIEIYKEAISGAENG